MTEDNGVTMNQLLLVFSTIIWFTASLQDLNHRKLSIVRLLDLYPNNEKFSQFSVFSVAIAT